MRSISSKLILAFLSIGIISVAIIFVTATLNTRAEFIRFLTDQTQTDIVTQLSDYYQQNGSWAGVESVLNPDGPGMGHAPPGPGPNHRFYPYTLTSESGTVIVPNGGYKRGDQVSQQDLAKGISITKDSKVIGILVPIPMPFQGRPREVEFIEQTNRILLYGALIGAVIALLLGISFRARSHDPSGNSRKPPTQFPKEIYPNKSLCAQVMNLVNSRKPSIK